MGSLMSFVLLLIARVTAIPTDRPDLKALTNCQAREGQRITLQCSVFMYSSDTDPLTWFWTCADEDLTLNAISIGTLSVMTFKAERTFNRKNCYCRAIGYSSHRTYNRTSTYLTIEVYYAPRTTPILNISDIIKLVGDDITLQCSMNSLGNPPVRWSWKCGTQTIFPRITNIGLTSKVVLKADRDLNDKSCYCEVDAPPQYEFKASSRPVHVSVLYYPTEYPRINTRTINVTVGHPVFLQCTLSNAGNPRVRWSWYCNDVMIVEGVRYTDLSSELTFMAKLPNDTVICYCRGKSSHTLMTKSYDQKSLSCYIKITDPATKVRKLSKEVKFDGISPVAFGATLASIIVALLFCAVIVVIQHRRIPKESSLLTWFFVKLGRNPNMKRESKSPPVSLEEFPDEHRYETLKTGNQN